MKWVKKGVIFNASGQYDWMLHHAGVPVADPIDERVVRIYFGPRDASETTRVGFIEVDAADPARVLRVHDRPVLSPGKLGAFDDSGVTPSCIVNEGGRKYLYYIGWNRGVTVPYRNSVGLAVSEDGGLTFTRVFEGPVVDRTSTEPYFTASPFVMKDGALWRIWYASCTGWMVVDGHPEPLYQVKYGESADGRRWVRDNTVCLPYRFEGEANARPCVLKEGGLYKMWYCWRGSVNYRSDRETSYRLGYAESPDAIHWTRKDDEVGIDRSASGWDSEMIEYPFVYVHGGRRFMLYNGNGFGRTGIGYAVEAAD